MHYLIPKELGSQLCAKWGLDPQVVMDISIDISPTQTAVLVRFKPDEGLVEVLGKYMLVPIDEVFRERRNEP